MVSSGRRRLYLLVRYHRSALPTDAMVKVKAGSLSRGTRWDHAGIVEAKQPSPTLDFDEQTIREISYQRRLEIRIN